MYSEKETKKNLREYPKLKDEPRGGSEVAGKPGKKTNITVSCKTQK